jgi:hypothetical protein
VLRIRIWDPVLFYPPDPGSGAFLPPGSGIRIRDRDWAMVGSRSGIKHPGSATLNQSIYYFRSLTQDTTLIEYRYRYLEWSIILILLTVSILSCNEDVLTVFCVHFVTGVWGCHLVVIRNFNVYTGTMCISTGTWSDLVPVNVQKPIDAKPNLQKCFGDDLIPDTGLDRFSL